MASNDKAPNLYLRLLKVMQAVDYIQKGDKKVNNQYRFVSHDQVTGAVRPHLVENGVVYFASVIEYKQDGNRTEATVDVTFVNTDNPEDKLTVRSLGFGVDPQDKGPGKAVSYAVKYALLKTLGLETGDDPDADTGKDYNHKPAKASPDSVSELRRIIGAGHVPDDLVATWMDKAGVTDLSGMTQDQVDKCIAMIQSKYLAAGQKGNAA